MKKIETDFLVIGAGIAGLAYAIKIAELLPTAGILVVTKTDTSECNTLYAQGGVAVVCDEQTDSFEQHIQDTLVSGAGFCDREVVEFVVKEAPGRLEELIRWGARFDRLPGQQLDLALEGGHTARRVVHKGDASGSEILATLLKAVSFLPNIRLLHNFFATELITVPDRQNDKESVCIGARILFQERKEEIAVFSRFTFIATGGIGHLLRHSTNPPVATGDGIALALRANASIRDMELIQYHPTVFFDQRGTSSFLISEAVRGEGAVLRRRDGTLFMHQHDPRLELAPRDVVSRAIMVELNTSGEPFVYLDCSTIPTATFERKFPNIFQKMLSMGIHLPEEMIPVVPAMHYLCGGIETDHVGKTSIRHLYAAGECARTGLHGANRLASNSLLEALVFAHRAAIDGKNRFAGTEFMQKALMPQTATFENSDTELLLEAKSSLQLAMNQLGPRLSSHNLSLAHEAILNLLNNNKLQNAMSTNGTAGWELRNMLDIANLIVLQSQNRTKNTGVFFNADLVI